MPGQQQKAPYVVVKEVGQEQFERKVNGLIAEGYRPVGGPWVMTVQHPLSGQEALGFLQAMLRHAHLSLS